MSEVSSFSSNEARRIDEGGGDDLIQKEKKKKENRYIFHNRRCFDESVCECVCFSLFFLVLRTQSRSSFFFYFYRCMHPLLGMMFFFVCCSRVQRIYIYIKKALTATMERKKKRHELLGRERSWLVNEGPLVGEGVKGWASAGWNDSDRDGLKLLINFPLDIISWISCIRSAFVRDGRAIWRTVRRILIVSILAMVFILRSSLENFWVNCGAFFRRYWTVVWMSKSYEEKEYSDEQELLVRTWCSRSLSVNHLSNFK